MKILAGLLIAGVAGIAGWLAFFPDLGGENQEPVAPMTGGAVADTAEPSKHTMNDVAKHDSEADCWTVIRGTVYDVTAFIDKHPGGDGNILKLCGIDGTAPFEGKHGGQEKPENVLKGFEIGKLSE